MAGARLVAQALRPKPIKALVFMGIPLVVASVLIAVLA
jgi:hypothetical protein